MWNLIDAPNQNAGYAETLAFNMYAERQCRIEQAIDILARTSDPNSYIAQNAAFQQAGLSINELSISERNYMEKEIAKRWIGTL